MGLIDNDGILAKKINKDNQQYHLALELYVKKQIIINDTSNYDNFYKLEEFVAYGPIRTELAKDSINTTIEGTFLNEHSRLYNIENKLIELDGSSQLKEFQNIIICLLKDLIPNLDNIIIKADRYKNIKRVIYKEKNNKAELSFSELAMGMRNIIGLFGDLFIKLSKEKNIKAIQDLEGIVIIDEFDNHLHPKWQRMLVEKLTKLFPKVQFIVSTHSPIPLLGAPPEQTVILHVNRTEDEMSIKRLTQIEKELPNMLPNVLLTSPVFGLDDIKSVYNKEIRDVVVDDNYKNRDKYAELDKSIDEFFKSNNWENNDFFKEEL